MLIESEDFWIGDSGTIFWGEEDPRKKPLQVIFIDPD